MIHNIPQPVFEEYLSQKLSKSSYATIHKDVSFVSSEEVIDILSYVTVLANIGSMTTTC